jgi:hypothetical protein
LLTLSHSGCGFWFCIGVFTNPDTILSFALQFDTSIRGLASL